MAGRHATTSSPRSRAILALVLATAVVAFVVASVHWDWFGQAAARHAAPITPVAPATSTTAVTSTTRAPTATTAAPTTLAPVVPTTTTVLSYPKALARTGAGGAPLSLAVLGGMAILLGAALTLIARPPLRHAHSFVHK
jgi:hypothetical protein